jgi:hypothetical protein
MTTTFAVGLRGSPVVGAANALYSQSLISITLTHASLLPTHAQPPQRFDHPPFLPPLALLYLCNPAVP